MVQRSPETATALIVAKRDGRRTAFDCGRLTLSIGHALEAVGRGDATLAADLASVVTTYLLGHARQGEVGAGEIAELVFAVLSGAGCEQAALWWGGAEKDEEIRDRYATLVESAERGELDDWTATPEGTLALVILVDQFRRNLHRGTAEAFADDARALRISLALQADGRDRMLPFTARVFLYMPMQHAEDPDIQRRSVVVFTALADEVAREHHDCFRGFADFAAQHCDLIERFGRFPHRNPILGRAPTAKETVFLVGGGATFGQ